MKIYKRPCQGDIARALELYVWNTQVGAAFGESLGFLEVALRNTLAGRMHARHTHRGRPRSWLDDPANELSSKAIKDIETARCRIRRKQKPLTEDQIIAELSFGFWRYLLAKRYQTTLWIDLYRGFDAIPGKEQRHTIEARVTRLHEFRNRLAHHEPVWNKPLQGRIDDIRDVLTYIEPQAATWWNIRYCRINTLLTTCPVRRPHP
ncbi:hypothetical protein AB0G02_30325 [Actinosynnema sp. NPDC023658]|uniref:hypothetical protein n=1 Tax=Actinosynnema sp. NPDC023658 TaxID=3155465 RepID=UPI0033FA0B2C